MRVSIAALAVLTVLPALLPAQGIRASETERFRSRAAYFVVEGESFSPAGQISVDSGTAAWQAQYLEQAEGMESGSRWRLGREFWSSLDSNAGFVMGGNEFNSGHYYLAMQKSDDGWDLLVVDADIVRAKQFDAGQAANIEGGTLVALSKATDGVEEDSEKVTIQFVQGKTPAGLKLRIDFGPYHLETPVVLKDTAGSREFVNAGWRRGSRMLIFSDGSISQAAIDHSIPEWAEGRGEQLDQQIKPGLRWRLGSDFWCNLDVHSAIKIGEVAVDPGYYYLVLERGEKDAWSLVLLEAAGIQAKKYDAFQVTGPTITGGVVIPMQTETLESAVAKTLRVGFISDDAGACSLEVAWGPHRMTVPVEFK